MDNHCCNKTQRTSTPPPPPYPPALPDIKHEFFLCATKVLHSPSTLVKHLSSNWETAQAGIFQCIRQQNILVRETPNFPRPSRLRFSRNAVCSRTQFFNAGSPDLQPCQAADSFTVSHRNSRRIAVSCSANQKVQRWSNFRAAAVL